MTTIEKQTERPDYEIARGQITALMQREGLDITAIFVPWSKSRSAVPMEKTGKVESLTQAKIVTQKDLTARSLNWVVTLTRHGRAIVTTDYSAGIAHCPSYQAHTPGTLRWTVDMVAALEMEIETGRRARSEAPRAGDPSSHPGAD